MNLVTAIISGVTAAVLRGTAMFFGQPVSVAGTTVMLILLGHEFVVVFPPLLNDNTLNALTQLAAAQASRFPPERGPGEFRARTWRRLALEGQ